MKIFRLAIASVAMASLVSCSTVDGIRSGLGLPDIDVSEVYAEAETFEDRVFLTAGLYDATLTVLVDQCEGAESASRVLACEKAAATAERLTPAVTSLLRSTALYLRAKQAFDAGLEADSIQDVAVTFSDLVIDYSAIEGDLLAFLIDPGL